jgi:hypothetical protein
MDDYQTPIGASPVVPAAPDTESRLRKEQDALYPRFAHSVRHALRLSPLPATWSVKARKTISS